jgi:formimidoylglutamate deiminase
MPSGALPGRERALWAPLARLPAGWREDVLLQVGDDGRWAGVQSGIAPPPGATVLAGPALPGLVNGHSHAFQRAFAGLAERRERDQDDFWSWRDRMYGVALRVTPGQQRAIAAQLFLELLRGGFTHVCEFHYLHNAPDGSAYAPPARAPGGTPAGADAAPMAWAIVEAARDVGIGLTMLPAIYERAGFARPSLREDQRRFRAGADAVAALRDDLRTAVGASLRVGAAVHSLRAATPESIDRLLAHDDDGPIHIHVAEQAREVDDCLAATGLRPVEWLCRHVPLDARWHLVHATHASAAEIDAAAQRGAGVVLCPGTEANLGDGVPDLPRWLQRDAAICLGTDSHVTRSATEELRLLELSQRLVRRVRCVGASPQTGEPSTAEHLWSRVLAGGGRAAGFSSWGLQPGARADLLVVDTNASPLLGIPRSQLLDAMVFSSPGRPFRDVLVAGRWIGRDHHFAAARATGERFVEVMDEIWRAPAGRLP